MATVFDTQGATQQNQGLLGGLNKITSGIAGGISGLAGQGMNALGNYAQNAIGQGLKTATGQLSQMNAGQPMTATGTTPGLIKPTTPVASHTITNTDGSTVKQTYQAPPPPKTLGDTNSTSQQEQTIQNEINADTSQLASMGYNPDGTLIQTGTMTNPTSTMSSVAANAPTGGNATPSASNNPQYAAAIGGLSAVQQQNNPVLQADTQAINQAQQQYKNLSTEQTGGTVGGSAGPESGVTGIQSQFALNALNSAQEQYANDLAEQNAQIAAGQAVGGLTQPVGQFGVLTNPQTGQPINGQTAAEAAQQGGYIQGLQSGAQAQGAVGGTTNAANASSLGTQAYNLDTALKAVSTVTPLLTSVMQQSGISSQDNPLYNQPINTYISQAQNPGAYKTYQLFLQTLQKYTQQIIGAGGIATPSGVQAAAALESPDGLSLSQINNYLTALNQDGQNQLSTYQKQVNQASPGNSIYTGSPASVSNSITTTPANKELLTGQTNPAAQATGGVTLNLAGAIPGLVNQMAGGILDFIGGVFTGKGL